MTHGFCKSGVYKNMKINQSTGLPARADGNPAFKSIKTVITGLAVTFFMAFVPAKNHDVSARVKHVIQATPAENTASLEQIEKQAFDLVNKHRKNIGLPALINKDFIVEQARQHSRDMTSGKVGFGHDGAAERLDIISKSMKEMNAGAENVFYCTGNYDNLAATALEGWLKSRGHRENIEGDYNLSGMGVAIAPNGDYYFTQIFVKGKK